MTELMEFTHGINVPLLRKVLEYITAHPDQHNQDVWMIKADTECGTAGCLAGWAATFAGHEVDTCNGNVPALSVHEYVAAHGEDQWTVPWNDEVASASVARVELGLTEHQASLLFESFNTRPKLWILSSAMTQGEIEIPPNLNEVV